MVELAGRSLLGKARERPDLVREVISRARRDGIASTAQKVRRQLGQDRPLGYSSAGWVIEVGEQVDGLRPGDAVACAGAGHANHAEIVSVPRNLCARVPSGVSLQTAAFTTIASVALHGIRLAEVGIGDQIAVIGCGLVGQIACRLLRTAGAYTIALDIDSDRVASAREGGADAGFVVDGSVAERVVELCDGLGVDAALVTAASRTNDPLILGTAIARDRGMLILVGAVQIDVPYRQFYEKELTVRASRSYGPGRYDPQYEQHGLDYPIGYVRWTERRNMEAVLALQAEGRLDLHDLISETIPVEAAPAAYERLVNHAPERGAIVLRYGEAAPDLAPIETEAGPDPDSMLGTSESPRRPLSGSPRIGLIGPGNFAQSVLVPNLLAAGARLELVGGGGGPSAAAAARRLGFTRTASEDELLTDPDIDAVVIATRHVSHAALAARALHAGKHVFVEKPLALTVDEVDEVLAAASGPSAGILAVGFNRRYSPQLVQAREFVGSPMPALASYRVSAGRVDGDHWVHDLVEGGGRALGELCHFIDSLVFVARSPVAEVHAYGYGEPRAPLQAYDRLVVNLALESGSVASLVYVADGSPRVPKERLEIFVGSRTAILDDYRTLELRDGAKRSRRKLRTQDKGHTAELAAFVHGMRTGRPPVPIPEVRNVSLATIAVVQSLRTGRPVRLSG